MELTVLKWLGDSSVRLLGRSIELTFRLILCFLPLGVYMLLLQKRKGASSVNTISVYTNERSKFQHIFPGFILVSIEPSTLDNFLNKLRDNVQNWVKENKYLLAFGFALILVVLMIIKK